MDELVQEKLKAMGYREVPKELAAILAEWKKRQDVVRPAPLSLDAMIGLGEEAARAGGAVAWRTSGAVR